MGAPVKIKGDRQFRRLVHQVVMENNPKGIAACMGIKAPTFRAYLNPNGNERCDLALLPQIIEAAEDDRPIHYLASLRDLVCFKVPETPGATEDLACCVREFGEFMTKAADMDKDQMRTPLEIERVCKEGREAAGAIMAFAASLDQED